MSIVDIINEDRSIRSNPAIIALITGLLPIIAVHTCYLLAASWQHVPWCVPYWDSCTSISATGRQGPEYYFFKATMIPTAMVMMLFWRLSHDWLQALGDAKNWQTKSIPFIGLIAAVSLILYTTALGASGDLFRLQRKIGVVIYFTFTYLAQLLLTRRIVLINRTSNVVPAKIVAMQVTLVISILTIGMISLLLNVFYDRYDEMEDAFEWVLALLIHGYFIVTYFAFNRTSFRITYSAGDAS